MENRKRGEVGDGGGTNKKEWLKKEGGKKRRMGTEGKKLGNGYRR
jgi:hypothetical protein